MLETLDVASLITKGNGEWVMGGAKSIKSKDLTTK